MRVRVIVRDLREQARSYSVRVAVSTTALHPAGVS